MTAPAAAATEWLTTQDVATKSKRHVVTVRRALESGELHGHQRSPGAPWRIDPAAADAWVRGSDSRSACGECRTVIRFRRRA